MKFWVDDYGTDEIRTKIEARLGRRLADLPAPPPDGYADHMGVHEQKQPGLFHVGVPVPLGIVRADQLLAVADLAGGAGADVRLTKHRTRSWRTSLLPIWTTSSARSARSGSPSTRIRCARRRSRAPASRTATSR
jgi:hypothetical protein